MIVVKKKLAGALAYRRQLIMALLLVATVLSTGFLNLNSAQAASPVKAMVSKFGNQVLAILANNRSVRQQKRQFSSVFFRNADINAIARFTLGKYARKIKPSQRKEFHRLLSLYIVQLFVVQMRGTRSKGLEVIRVTETKKNRKFLVKSVINVYKKPGFSNAPIPVKWQIYKSKTGNLKLFDINIGGFWLAQEQRSTFVKIISKNKGKISALLDYLKKETAE